MKSQRCERNKLGNGGGMMPARRAAYGGGSIPEAPAQLRKSGPTPSARRRKLLRHGFTLLELLVVMGLTAILMLVLFAPLSRSIDLSSRANAKIAGQDNVRSAMRRVVRDLSNAMEVYDPQNMAVYGFDAWTFRNKQFFPANGASPEAYITRNTLIAFRLPKHRYYCTRFDHYVTPRDIDNVFPPPRPFDDAVALDTCPRAGHNGSLVDLRPLSPMEPDDRIAAYFVGLKNPAPAATGTPLYENILLFRNTRNNTLNTYGLYRVEFDPRGLPGTDGNGNGLDDRYETLWTDPGFFYDATPVSVTENGNSVTKPRYEWWKDLTISVMDAETSDVVRWLEAGGSGKVIPQSLVSFKPSPSEDEAAQPNRNVGSFQLPGSALPTEFAPLEYVADYGHWTGIQHNGTSPIANATVMAPDRSGTLQHGVRIRVLDGSNPLFMNTVFDTNTGVRDRLVSYDSVTGRVVLGIPRSDLGATAANSELQKMLLEAYAPDIDPNTYTVDLKQDLAVYPSGHVSAGMPSAFGSALAAYPNFTRIVPGSESVELVDLSGSVLLTEQLRRAGWTAGSTNTGEFVAQPDMDLDEYSIDYVTGVITLSTRDPNHWAGVGANSNRRLLVKYKIQTNRPTDVVRLSYLTKEMVSAHLGVVQYTRRRQEVLPFEVTERVAVRNLRR